MFIFIVSILCVSGLTACLEFIPPQKIDKSLVVSTNTGEVQGIQKKTESGSVYWAYQGIPFAKPPMGNLRFRAPEPPSPWRGVLDGTEERSTCVQTVLTLDNDITFYGNEDCLYINVYTPRLPNKQREKLPVLVWFYGGAFMFGNSSSSFYGSENLLNQNIITVTFNYRVGPFGFLSTGDMASPGNYGLKDQNYALKWVQENIQNFGGDKNRVTISGQSAGAASVMYQMASPESRGLFSGVISSSGSPLCTWAFTYNPAKTAFDYGLAAGVQTKSTEELIKLLRQADVDVLKGASRLLLLLSLPNVIKAGFPFAPTIEPHHNGAFITKSVYSSFEKGDFHKVPIMMGINSLETLFFAGGIKLLKPLNLINDISPSSLPSEHMNIRTQVERREAGLDIIKQYFKDGSVFGSTIKEYLEFTSDDQFTRPLHKTVQLMSKHTPLYFYTFSYISDIGQKLLNGLIIKKPVQGVAHGEDIFYIWRRQSVPLPNGFDQITATRLIKIWSNFIKTGNPTPQKEPILNNVIWPIVTSHKNIPYFNIDKNISINYNYRNEQIKFWTYLYRKYGHPPYVTY
ncbi:carboxylic ester hydrolase-like [Diorhabda carinulata]|uniref:carboxylic ester hydrolase-like n=1 Tax=Diorhabda carinulata TaxID=1163345 RepID=UPI0025A0B395|nr:carboxylic ester hydrolase-like [Diorhabda carinulata]